jgi:antitoxin CptB
VDAPIPLDAEARRLLWRCRRGMKELDVLLERFAKGVLPTASPEDRQILARFLELPDPLLVDYLLGQVIPEEAELARLIQRITASVPRTAAPASLQSASLAPDPITPSP